jgi:hypothetical protein
VIMGRSERVTDTKCIVVSCSIGDTLALVSCDTLLGISTSQRALTNRAH